MTNLSAAATQALVKFRRIANHCVNCNDLDTDATHDELVQAGLIRLVAWPTGDPLAGWKHYQLNDSEALNG